MKNQRSKKELWSVAVLCALIIGNVLIYLPTHLALSDSKSALANEDPVLAASKNKQKTSIASKLGNSTDFGSETIEPLPPLSQESAKKGFGRQNPNQQLPNGVLPPDVAMDRYAPADAAMATGKTPGLSETGAPNLSPNGLGTDDSTAAPNSAPNSGLEGEENTESNEAATTVLNGSEIEIAALVKTFSKLTKRNYVVDNNVKGKVAIHLATPVSIGEALRIFESVLLLKGFTTVPMGDNTWKVIAAKDARQTTIPSMTSATDQGSDSLVTQLIRLRNIQASEIQQVLSQFVSKDGLVTAFGGTNAVILIDSAANIKRLTKLIDQLDVPALDQDITIIPITHADSKDIAEKIEEILGEKDKSSDAARPAGVTNPFFNRPQAIPPVPGQVNASNPQGVATGADQRQLPLKIIPDERTNSIIVVADEFMTDRVKALVEQLDSEVDRSTGRFYVYRLKHADAEEIAEIINAVIGGGSSGSTGSSGSSSASSSSERLTGSSARRNSQRSRSSGSSDSNDPFSSVRERLASGNNRSGGVVSAKAGESDGAKVNLEGEVTVAADPSTNALVINASRGDYEKLKTLIDDLDIKRRQVLVEATILEVSLTGAEEKGMEWQTTAGTDSAGVFAQNNFGGLTNIISNPSGLSDLTIAAASTGSIVLPGGITLPSQALLITALSRNENVNVLSTPTIMATDNQEAEIVVGQNVPFVTSTATNQTNISNTFNQIEREDVGIKLRITPQISAGDFVVLKIFVEISSVVTGTTGNANGPTTNLRTTETMVEVKSDQMVVTGGLISDSKTEADRGVPYLQDIPVLGNLFKKEREENSRTNLLIFITPRIVADQFDARDQTKSKKKIIEKVIEEKGSQPDRYEVLNSPDMDKVVEEYAGDEIKPTTVTPPSRSARASVESLPEESKAAAQRTLERLNSLKPGKKSEVNHSSDGESGLETSDQPAIGDSPISVSEEEVEINVRPRMPGEKVSGEKASSPSKSAAEITARRSTNDRIADLPLPRSSAEGNRTFVVLRAIRHNPESAERSLPFRYADLDRTLGVSVFGALGSPSGRFFEVGRRYRLELKGKTVDFVCLGRFGARSEAITMHPALEATDIWYTLTPEKSLSLGSGAWKRMD